ncbi:MAG TPA: hypothetical protein VMU63_06135 [Acidimicrobiales bacterium]|nr:hypothetical protein [Acidimicrobiales bacterium]
MHVRLTLVEGTQDMDAAAKVLAEQVVPGLKEQKGFAGLTASGDKSAGLLGILSIWQTEADLEASSSAVGKLRGNAIDAMGGRLVGVENFEQVEEELTGAPPGPGSRVVIIRSKRDPAKVDEDIAFFRANVLGSIQALPGVAVVRSMMNRQTGEAQLGVVVAEAGQVDAVLDFFRQAKDMAASHGVTLEEPSVREVIFAAMG